MNNDSDDEIRKLRAEALSTRSSNLRKRKVTLINNRKIITGEDRGDKRKILVQTRKVVVGACSDSPIQSQKVSTTAFRNEDNSESLWPTAVMDTVDTYPVKKPKLQNERRILTGAEKQVKTGKDQRIFTQSNVNRNIEEIILLDSEEEDDFVTDVRVILSEENEGRPSVQNYVHRQDGAAEDELENALELNASIDIDDSPANEEAEEVTVVEERLPVRRIEVKNSQQKTGIEEVVDVEGDEEDGEEEEVEEGVEGNEDEEEGVEEGHEEEYQEEQEVENEEKEESGEQEEEDNKEVKVVKEDEEEKMKNGQMEKGKANVKSDEATKSAETTGPQSKRDAKESKTLKSNGKGESGKKNEKTVKVTSKEREQTKSAGESSDGESSGSESDSSRSSSSSSSSGSSSSSYSSSSSSSRSSRSSSGSRSSSVSKSGSVSDGEKPSRSPKRSSRSSSLSSSYSYSTVGSAEKTRMRSVVSQKDKESRRSRSPRRSPLNWRSPRDRRHFDGGRSYDSGDRYRRNGIRERRDESPRYRHRRSPHSRLGRRSPSPARFNRSDRRRSRERGGSRDRRFNRPEDRSHPRRTRSMSLEKKKDSSTSDKNNLSRTDDDFVEVDVGQKPDIKDTKLRKSGKENVRKRGFDLRSKLGPKKTEMKRVITNESSADAQQKLKQKAREVKEQVDEEEVEEEEVEEQIVEEDIYEEDDEQNGEESAQWGNQRSPILRKTVVTAHGGKEAELDAKILRIQMMNEAIRKRREEIEREKMLYG